MKVVESPGGAASISCLIDVLLSGFISEAPGANVSRSPVVVGAAVVAAWSETAGGAGGCAPGGGAAGVIGETEAVSGTISGMAGCAAGGEAGGVTGETVREAGPVAGWVVVTVATRGGATGTARAGWLADGRSGSACSACR